MSLTREEINTLEEELWWCREHLKDTKKCIDRAMLNLNKYRLRHNEWGKRFKVVDRKLAFATKLKKVKRGSSKDKDKNKNKNIVKPEKISKTFENILKDKDKLARFIKLLEDEKLKN